MIKRLTLALLASATLAGATHAQFNLDISPSGMRAEQAKNASDAAKELENRPGLHPLSPLGGKQGTPLTIQPAAPASAVQAYAGATYAPNPSDGPVDLNGKPLPSDPSVDDPNKVRKPLQPKSLQQGVAPRL